MWVHRLWALVIWLVQQAPLATLPVLALVLWDRVACSPGWPSDSGDSQESHWTSSPPASEPLNPGVTGMQPTHNFLLWFLRACRPWAQNPLAFACWVLTLQACTKLSSSIFISFFWGGLGVRDPDSVSPCTLQVAGEHHKLLILLPLLLRVLESESAATSPI